MEYLERLFGPTQVGGARFNRDTSKRWAGAGGIFYDVEDDPEGTVIVDLPGSLLAEKRAREIWGIVCGVLSMGFRPTRLDVAVDLFESFAWLIPQVYGSCEAGELCGARRYRRDHSKARAGVSSGDCVYIGARGKDGSGRFLRVYDKGLETGEREEGQWVRVEAEFTDQCAAEAALALQRSEDWEEAAGGVVFGCIDFRESNGRTKLTERPRMRWWSDLVAGLRLERVKVQAVGPSLRGYCRWLERCVIPQTITYAQEKRLSLAEFFAIVAPDAEPSERYLLSPVGRELAATGAGGIINRHRVGMRGRGRRRLKAPRLVQRLRPREAAEERGG